MSSSLSIGDRTGGLPLAHPGTRGRFSLPAIGFQIFVPLILSLVLLGATARALAYLRPAFETQPRVSPVLPPASRRAPRVEGLDSRPDRLSPIFTPEIQRWASSIRRWAAEYSVPVDLVAVVIQIESCGDPRAVSPAGAMGLFQVMPVHFSPGDDPFDVETNAEQGLRYLASGLILASDDPVLALAGYNGGHGVIGLPNSQWPAETQRYVSWGIGILRDAGSGLAASPRLAAWLAAGGDRLCRQAAERLAGGLDAAPSS